VQTPLFITNWIQGFMSFQYSSSLSVIHVKQDIFHTFIHWSKYSTDVLYIKFTPAQNLSHSSSHASLHFSASSSLTFMGTKFRVTCS